MKPLADCLRPKTLDDFVGQSHLLAQGQPLRCAIERHELHSMILWGNSGVGKTTLAHIICQQVKGYLAELNAVLDGVKELRKVVENAKKYQALGQTTVLFVDEIHRFNKAQQDAFLPHIESGLMILIGATTQNPSFELNAALLSRMQVYRFESLSELDLSQVLVRCLSHLNLTLGKVNCQLIVRAALGDARRLINIVEQVSHFPKAQDFEKLSEFLKDKVAGFDKDGDDFYQQLSAFHKSVRGSSPDGALYWMARMLVAGCDVKVIARRLLAIASEDIGNADPRALQVALNAWEVYERVGAHEGHRAVAQAAVYCAVAPKSNAVYQAFNQAMQSAKDTSNLPVPKHLCNAPTALMKDLGYKAGYRYDHSEPEGVAQGQTYFPQAIGEQIYYQPIDRGLEIKISEKLKHLRQQ
jgi:putative ATPase